MPCTVPSIFSPDGCGCAVECVCISRRAHARACAHACVLPEACQRDPVGDYRDPVGDYRHLVRVALGDSGVCHVQPGEAICDESLCIRLHGEQLVFRL